MDDVTDFAIVLDVGVWIQVQLRRRERWIEAIMKLIAKGALHFSSGPQRGMSPS